MEKVVSALEEIKSINNAYGISIDGICKLRFQKLKYVCRLLAGSVLERAHW